MDAIRLNGEADPPLDLGAQACVVLLEQVLASAKNGEISTVCIVACGPSSFGASFAGPDAARLNLGLDTAKAQILQMVSQPTPRSGAILRPGMRW